MGKKWGHYAVGGRSQPVTCIYCGRLTPRVKAVPVRKGSWLDTKMVPGLDRRKVFIPSRKAYACISCAKHRGML